MYIFLQLPNYTCMHIDALALSHNYKKANAAPVISLIHFSLPKLKQLSDPGLFLCRTHSLIVFSRQIVFTIFSALLEKPSFRFDLSSLVTQYFFPPVDDFNFQNRLDTD